MSGEEEWANATFKEKAEAYLRYCMSPPIVLLGTLAGIVGAWLALRT